MATRATRRPNARQNTFVDNILAGMSEIDAYVGAGYSGPRHTLYGSASRLLSSDTVQTALGERSQAVRVSEGIDLETIVKELKDLALDSKVAKQYNVSRQCWVDIGKALDLIKDKHEVHTTSTSYEVIQVLGGMTREELILAASHVPQALPEGQVVEGSYKEGE